MACVLVIDHSLFQRTRVGTDLMTAGHQAVLAGSAYEAWDLAEIRRPDLIVMEWTFPQYSGPEILRVLKSKGMEVPVIVCTAIASPSVESEAQEAGVSVVISKPYGRKVFLDAVAQVLDEGRPTT